MPGRQVPWSGSVSPSGGQGSPPPGSTSGPAPSGWTPEPELGFRYTDKGRTAVFVYRRSLEAEEEIILPQAGWTGSLLLFHE